MKVLKGALIGCGFFSRNHLHAWNQLQGVEIVALCDSDKSRLDSMANDFGIEQTYIDAKTMLGREKFDFIDIATTVSSHRNLVELAAAAGIPVICQKPFAETMEDAQAMVTACERAAVPLMVHENFRWQTPIQAVRKLIDEGAIGKPFWGRFSFRSGFDVYRAQPYLAKGKRFIIEDLGIHILDIARYLLGDVALLSATVQRVNSKINGEDVATMLLTHACGATSIVDCSYASRRAQELFPQTLLEIDGVEGSIRVDADYRLTVYHKVQGTRVITVKPPLQIWAEQPWFNIQDSVLNIQAHWLESLNAGTEPLTSGRDNLKTLALVESAYASADNNQAVQIL